MPIDVDVRDYAWQQTETELVISIPMKGVQRDKVDIFSTDKYVKVSFLPFIFELFYAADVVDEESTTSIGGGLVSLRLKKKEHKMWETLEKPGTSQLKDLKLSKTPARAEKMSKEELQKLRETAILEAQAREVAVKRMRADRKEEERREAVKQQIETDDEERARKAAARKSAIDEAMTELNEWRKLKAGGQGGAPKSATKSEAAQTGVRTNGKVKVSFTERVFPTPLRESKIEQEEEWLKQQNEAAKARDEFEDSNKDFTEKDPLWLKDRGDAFYSMQDFRSAINAYTYAIRRGSRLPALFSNRAACHLHLTDYVQCVKDCSQALDLLNPPVADNLEQRLKSLVRRGKAFTKLDMLPDALKDYQDALRLDPADLATNEAVQAIRAAIQGATWMSR